RTTMLHCVARHIPDLLPWATFCYSQPVHLFGEGGLLPFKSSSGVQQGDPLGPFLFSLCLRQCCLRLRDELRDTLSVWYLDDGTLGPVEQVRQGWDIVLQELELVGLKVNLGKTEWFAPGGHPPPHPGMETLLPDGFALLGSPIGTPAYCDSFVAERIQKIRRCAQEMDQVKDPQIELALLKFCILMPKFNFALRSTPPQHIPHSIREFDALVTDTWLRRFGISMSPAQATQSALPAPSGLGLYRAVDIAPSAFLANVLCCTDLVGALLGDARPPEGLAGFAGAQALYEASLRPVYPPRREVPPP
ncbi:MAG: hypothetical protein GY928_26255, partial [Colwellia sp.]|nr:hypothetical protein [Colwellia sp.]